ERKLIVEAGVIALGEDSIPCVILDISESGASLMLSDVDQDCPESFTLLPVYGDPRHCRQRWRLGEKVGVEFVEKPQ
ncbi:MAG: hypothetical protein OEM59_12895, partial [Rhodospirillales bacterium]|nr:hypothetical protein [Rhodospirillales bacterium]